MEAWRTGPPRGDARAVVLRDQAMARGMLLAIGIPYHDVADVTQEVVFAADRRRPHFEVPPGRSPAGAWRAFLWGIVERQAARYRWAAARRREGERGAAESGEEAAPSAEEVALSNSCLATLRAAVERLRARRPALWEVLWLHLDGATAPRVAATLHIPVATAWNRLRLARNVLRETLRRWSAEERDGIVRRRLRR